MRTKKFRIVWALAVGLLILVGTLALLGTWRGEAPAVQAQAISNDISAVLGPQAEISGTWTHDGTEDEWEFGTPSNTNAGAPTHCASGPEGCWVTDLDANYNNEADESLYSPVITVPVSAALPLSVTWQQAWYIQKSVWDKAYADYRCNGGGWASLWKHNNDSDAAENWQAVPDAPFTLTCGLSDTVEFRFRLTSNNNTTYPGYYIDDLRLYDADGRTLYSTEPPQIRKTAQPSTVQPGDQVTYSLRVTNTRATDPTFAISDSLDSHQKPLSVAADRGTCAVADGGWGGGVTCTLPSMAVDESVAVTVTAQTTDWINAFQIGNSAVVSDGLQTAEAQATVEVDACYVRLVESGTTTTTHDTIQDAVDAASGSDSKVLVAGTCGDLSTREGQTQIAYISKTLTLRGGYNANFTAHDPEQYPTVLDAQGQGRALYIYDPEAVTVTHLTLTGGNGDGDSGGAVYAHLDDGQHVTFESNIIKNNTADSNGGGIYVRGNTGDSNYGHVTLHANTVQSNTALGYAGGGVCIGDTDQVTVTNNIFQGNEAQEYGGGFRIWESSPLVFSGNQVLSNTARAGGGLNLHNDVYQATLISNTIAYNVADNGSDGNGGGLLKTFNGEVVLEQNTLFSNTASGYGGGLYFKAGRPILRFNDIRRNHSGEDGGGVYLGDDACQGDNLMRGNLIRENDASGNGGGILFHACEDMQSFANNVVIDNTAAGYGSGIRLEGGSWEQAVNWTLQHTTLGNNTGGNEDGVYAVDGADPTLKNTLIYSQAKGVVAAGDAVTLDYTFWDADSVGTAFVEAAGGTVSETHARQGGAVLRADGYHLTGGSDAINQGASSISDDVDGQSRADGSPDIGADEYSAAVDPGLDKARQGSGDVEAGQPVTYTLTVSNSADSESAVTVLLTDTLTPSSAVDGVAFQTSSGDSCSASADGFTCTVQSVPTDDQRTVTAIVTTAASFEGLLTNTAQLVALGGTEMDASNNAAGPVTVTVVTAAPDQPDLWVSKRASAQYLQSGDSLTYTLQWGNQGEIAAASSTLTDTLPADVTLGNAEGSPSQNGRVLTWDLGSVAAGDSGTYQVTVTSDDGLDDGTLLVNQAAIGSATAESATGNNADQVTSTVYATGGISLTITKDALDVANDEVELEDKVQYRVVISNSGLLSTPFTLEDAIPEGTEYVDDSVSSQPLGAAYVDAADKIYWDHSDVLTAGMSATVTFKAKVVACGGVDCGVIRNTAQARVPDVSYVWQAQRDLWVKCPDLAVSVGERGQSGRPTYFHYDGLLHDNEYHWGLTYENIDKGNRVSLAASPHITLTLTGNAHFATGAADIDPDPAQAEAQRIIWNLDELAPGASDKIDYFTIILDGYDNDGYTLEAEIGPATGEECESQRANNTDDEDIPAVTMDFQKKALIPRLSWQFANGQPTTARFRLGYKFLLNYRNSYPAQPMAYDLEIEDVWPDDLPLDWHDGHLDGVGQWDFREENNKFYWNGDSVLEGARGWLDAGGYLSQTTKPGTKLLNNAWLSFEPSDDRGGVYQEKAEAEGEVPLLQPVILRPQSGLQMCPGETFDVRGIAQEGVQVNVYLNGTLKKTVSPDNLDIFHATLTAVSGPNKVEVSASHGGEETGRDSVTVRVPGNLLWSPYGSNAMGTVGTGPQKGQVLSFDIDDPSDFTLPSVYGFNDMTWSFRTCGCPNSSHTMSVTVSADNGQYTDVDTAPGDSLSYAVTFLDAADDVSISAICQDPDNPNPNPDPGDVQDSEAKLMLIDPDGYVFDVNKGGRYDPTMGGSFNPVEAVSGVTVTCYVSQPTWGGWIPWPAHVYSQTNPQVTDDSYPDGITTTGYYAFYTPPGHYYLEIEGIEGYQPWRSPVVEVVDEVVHVNVPYTPLPESAAVSVTLTANEISSPVVTVPVGSAVQWNSALNVTDTITNLVQWDEDPILHPKSELDPLLNTRGFDAGLLQPGRSYRRAFSWPGTYTYTVAAGTTGRVIVTGEEPYTYIYLPLVLRQSQ